MPKITESTIEDLAIQCLDELGYTYFPGPEIAPDGETPMRASFEDVLLLETLKAAIDRLNPSIPPAFRINALKQVQHSHAPELVANNQKIRTLKTLRDTLLPKLMGGEVQG